MAIIFATPVIVLWANSITTFFLSTRKGCFSGIDLAAFFLLPLVFMIIYLWAGDQVSQNSFRTIGFLMGSTWLSLGLSICLSIAWAARIKVDISQKLPDIWFESIFFSVLSFCGTLLAMELGKLFNRNQ